MSNPHQLRELRDAELLSGLSGLAKRCNELTAEMLAHLIEVDNRMLFAELAFPNLSAYCVESLGLSEGSAGRRCTAARVWRRFPEAFELVARGELHLSAFVRVGEAPDSGEVQFTADARLRELLDRACALCGHSVSDGELAHVVERALEVFVGREEKRRFAIGCRPRKAHGTVERGEAERTPPGGAAPTTLSSKTRSRHVPASTRREVYARDGGQCSYVAKDRRRCSARAWLELDHVQPWARMGASDPSNVRLRCRAHDVLHAKRSFGELHVAAMIAARRSPQG